MKKNTWDGRCKEQEKAAKKCADHEELEICEMLKILRNVCVIVLIFGIIFFAAILLF